MQSYVRSIYVTNRCGFRNENAEVKLEKSVMKVTNAVEFFDQARKQWYKGMKQCCKRLRTVNIKPFANHNPAMTVTIPLSIIYTISNVATVF